MTEPVTNVAMPFFQMSGISKRYGGVRALENAELLVKPGRVHAILCDVRDEQPERRRRRQNSQQNARRDRPPGQQQRRRAEYGGREDREAQQQDR